MIAQYECFWRAAERHDRETVLAVICAHPELHDYEGEAGSLVEILDREAPELLEPAFQAGLSPEAGVERPIQTFLQKAAAEGDLERLRLGLQYGADVEKRNDWGEVALGYACSHGQLTAVRMLVEAGADVNAIEERVETGLRNTPLDCTGGHPEIAVYLRAHGAGTYAEFVYRPGT
jgi:hypothetical protein